MRIKTDVLQGRLLLPVLLCIVYLAQCLWFIGTQSFTADEPDHIFAGQEAWRHSRFEFKSDHPPLARLLLALPVISRGLGDRSKRLSRDLHPTKPRDDGVVCASNKCRVGANTRRAALDSCTPLIFYQCSQPKPLPVRIFSLSHRSFLSSRQ